MSDITRAALRGFFDHPHVGDQAMIDADGADYCAASDHGDTLLPPGEACRCVAATTRAEPSA